MKRFDTLNLSDKTLAFIDRNGFREATVIQEKVIPAVLKKKDVIALSKTGTGKTHAYLIPLMEMIDTSADWPYAVITAPTRELAVQIFEKAKVMTEVDPDLRIGLYVGGRQRSSDVEQLQNRQPHLVIGTPGRIRDLFLDSAVLRIDKVSVLVVDEADMTLEYGFLNDIDAFAGRMPDDLQMLAFSATIPEQLKPFLKKYMHHPITMKAGEDTSFDPKITHVLVPCYHHTYAETIRSILPGFNPYTCLIFTNTREEAEKLAEDLRNHDIPVTEIHGNLESRKRKQALKDLQSGRNTYVVATDLAARGIDIDTVTHVISCGFPNDLSFYIHRSGRTGRAGADGVCYALYKDEDKEAIRSLQRMGIRFHHRRFRNGSWNDLKPLGQRRRKDDELKTEIAKMMTKKNTKVKPGYKKKRERAIEELHRKKKREFIRSKIKEEKKAYFKERQKALNNSDDHR